MVRRGTSLVELMVVVFVFSLLMTLILGFYVHASSVTRKRDAQSQQYRRITQTLDKVETLLQEARVFGVYQDQIVYTTLQEPAVVNRVAAWDPIATTLISDGNKLMLRRTGSTRTILLLQPGEHVDFNDQGNYIDVTYNAPKNLRVTRRVLLEVY
ncbi:MAG: hypothetical protein AB1758_08080 [Candidatus Eremiobacterota bacterium]